MVEDGSQRRLEIVEGERRLRLRGREARKRLRDHVAAELLRERAEDAVDVFGELFQRDEAARRRRGPRPPRPHEQRRAREQARHVRREQRPGRDRARPNIPQRQQLRLEVGPPRRRRAAVGPPRCGRGTEVVFQDRERRREDDVVHDALVHADVESEKRGAVEGGPRPHELQDLVDLLALKGPVKSHADGDGDDRHDVRKYLGRGLGEELGVHHEGKRDAA
mmetsp:Transcript_22464/g.77047  ORF Transcript_22464/g.77047 Transcript_22464/m.77047 type:complete len:221 (-) Transcript_22464:2345-3007(-)